MYPYHRPLRAHLAATPAHFQSSLTVLADTPSTAAISASLSPPKNRSSTTRAARGSTSASLRSDSSNQQQIHARHPGRASSASNSTRPHPRPSWRLRDAAHHPPERGGSSPPPRRRSASVPASPPATGPPAAGMPRSPALWVAWCGLPDRAPSPPPHISSDCRRPTGPVPAHSGHPPLRVRRRSASRPVPGVRSWGPKEKVPNRLSVDPPILASRAGNATQTGPWPEGATHDHPPHRISRRPRRPCPDRRRPMPTQHPHPVLRHAGPELRQRLH